MEKRKRGGDDETMKVPAVNARALTIDMPTTDIKFPPATNIDKEPKSPAQKILLSWEDVARRARIFESCGVFSPEQSPVNMAQGPYPSLNEAIEAMKNEAGQQYESFARQQTVPNPFQFPHRPIEKIELLNTEVELERQSAKRKALKRAPSIDEINSAFELDDEVAAKKKPTSPYYQKLVFDGENVSGVW